MKSPQSAHSFHQAKIVAFSWTVEEKFAVPTVENVMKYSQILGNLMKMIGAAVFPGAGVAAFFAWTATPHLAPPGHYHEYCDRASMSRSY